MPEQIPIASKLPQAQLEKAFDEEWAWVRAALAAEGKAVPERWRDLVVVAPRASGVGFDQEFLLKIAETVITGVALEVVKQAVAMLARRVNWRKGDNTVDMD